MPTLPPEFDHPTHTLRIPELRNVSLTSRVLQIVDHPAFQRLRTIRQLGPTHLVYPGAVHTRFEHSLGVYQSTHQLLSHILHLPQLDSLKEQDILSILAAALLHDIGHYPFAHSLEALHLKGKDTPRHEDVGAQIIRGQLSSLHGKKSIASILKKEWKVDPERVITLCTGKLPKNAGKTDKILRSIISGAIDADKMDYLERDSHHMGVPYGRNYDRQRLLQSFTLNKNEDALAILARGKVSAEMFVFARYTMFSEAYWHHTVRAASAMVESALAAFYSRSSLEPHELLPILLSKHDDEFLSWLLEQSPENSATTFLISGMTRWNRNLYKRVLTLSRVYLEEEKQRAYDIVYSMDSSEIFALTDRLRVALGMALRVPLHPAALILDTPPRDKDKLDHIELVYPDASGQQHYPLHQLSRIVAGVQNDFVHVVKKIRLFAEPKLALMLKALPNSEEIILREILQSNTHS